MKLFLCAAALAVATVSCGGGAPAEDVDRATGSLARGDQDPGLDPGLDPPVPDASVPDPCETIPDAQVPVMRTRFYANGAGLVCSLVTTARGHWAASPTLHGVSGFCTFDWVGGGTPDLVTLRKVLPAETVFDRAMCGGTVNGGPNARAIVLGPEGGISCGACTHVGGTYKDAAMFVLPLRAVGPSWSTFRVVAPYRGIADVIVPPNTQVVWAYFDKTVGVLPNGLPLFLQ
jgi:hypothetical protein